MELNVSVKTKNDIERFILIINIGITTAIKEGLISIEESENYFYSPYSVEKIKKLGVSEDVVKLVQLGCELEDIESIIPGKLNYTIDEMLNKSIELFYSIPKSISPSKKWID